MEKEKHQQLSPEEIAKIQKERVLSDAEFILRGGDYVMDEGAKEPRLEITNDQKRKVFEHMEKMNDEERREKLLEYFKKIMEKKSRRVSVELSDEHSGGNVGRWIKGEVDKILPSGRGIGFYKFLLPPSEEYMEIDFGEIVGVQELD